MRRERSTGGARRVRARRGLLWLGGVAVLVVAVVVLGSVGPVGPPSGRPAGAGLPPTELPRPVGWAEGEAAAVTRRAEIAEEEARLAALRSARNRLELEIAALRQEVEERRREMPGRKVVPDGAATGQAGPAAAAAGGGIGATVSASPAAVALAPPAEPTSRGPRVFVHHRAESRPGAAAAEEVAQTLRGAGFEVAGVRGARFVPAAPVVRYFHEEDQAAAVRLAGRLGRGWAIQDFRAFQPQPPPQTLEVWLPGS